MYIAVINSNILYICYGLDIYNRVHIILYLLRNDSVSQLAMAFADLKCRNFEKMDKFNFQKEKQKKQKKCKTK